MNTTTPQKEIRKAELRLDQPTDKPRKFVGLAARYDSPSQDLGGFVEIIRKGAFSQSLENNDEVVFLVNHNNDLLLCRRSTGSLILTDTDEGLQIEANPPVTSYTDHVRTMVESGEWCQMSFGFFVEEDKWTEQDDGKMLRELIKVKVFDVSVVTDPAYVQTSISLRSLDEFRKQQQPQRRGNKYYAQILLGAV